MGGVSTGNVIEFHKKIENGSKISIGRLRTITIVADHHFNWFQKKMIKWCFGFTVENYSEE